MGEIIKNNNTEDIELQNEKNEVIQITEEMLVEARKNIEYSNIISVPIIQLASLGASVSSLIPSLRTVTQTINIDTSKQGLCRILNANIGDTLKATKNGNFWGALNTAVGKSKMAQLEKVDSLSVTTSTIMPINPATIMMAAALYSIEKQLGEIADMQRQILDFLEREKKAEIEADVETLVNIINKYKLNWDNEHFVTGNHKMVLDIQRTARKNMNAYQKEVAELMRSKKLFTVQTQVKASLNKLQDKFNYYRLSLFTYSLASLLEVMLSGNFKEDYICGIRNELSDLSITYRSMFEDASAYIEKMSDLSFEMNALKGLGAATKGVGNIIGAIPFVKKGPVDEFLQDSGETMKGNAEVIKYKSVKEFAPIANPGIAGITRQMDAMVKIYNHTSEIYFDNEKIYLLTNLKSN